MLLVMGHPMALLDFELLTLLGAIFGTAVLARVTRVPITGLEIAAGIVLVGTFGFGPPSELQSLVILGSLLIVFLAGLETSLEFLRKHHREAVRIGPHGLLLPFLGLFFFLVEWVHVPFLIGVVGATALADTSISIVYSTTGGATSGGRPPVGLGLGTDTIAATRSIGDVSHV